jgi:hypothetical protein
MYTLLKNSFADISNFGLTKDYLPILNGCIGADLVVLFFLFHNIAFQSKYLKLWYKKFTLSAALADVLILMIGIIIARFFYRFIFNDFSIIKFTGLALAIQITHDFLFYLLFRSTPIGYSYILDFFKKYAGEISYSAIIGDSVMMIIACLLSSYMATFNVNINIIILIVSLYFYPFMLYIEK